MVGVGGGWVRACVVGERGKGLMWDQMDEVGWLSVLRTWGKGLYSHFAGWTGVAYVAIHQTYLSLMAYPSPCIGPLPLLR
jgi:hypothetical protein